MQDESLTKYLEMAVLTERNARKFYGTMALKHEGEEEISSIFSRLARDEAIHEEQFKEIISRSPETRIDVDDDTMQYLRATSLSRFFSEDFERMVEGEVRGPQDVLLLAFRFEKATLLFYGAIEAAHGESEALREIIGAERRHLFQLMKVILTDARFRGLSDSW